MNEKPDTYVLFAMLVAACVSASCAQSDDRRRTATSNREAFAAEIGDRAGRERRFEAAPQGNEVERIRRDDRLPPGGDPTTPVPEPPFPIPPSPPPKPFGPLDAIGAVGSVKEGIATRIFERAVVLSAGVEVTFETRDISPGSDPVLHLLAPSGTDFIRSDDADPQTRPTLCLT
jgi:hypothetical protein